MSANSSYPSPPNEAAIIANPTSKVTKTSTGKSSTVEVNFQHVVDYVLKREKKVLVPSALFLDAAEIRRLFMNTFNWKSHSAYITSDPSMRVWVLLNSEIVWKSAVRGEDLIYIQIRKATDKSPNISPANTLNRALGEDVKRLLTKAKACDAFNSADPYTYQTKDDLKKENDEQLYIVAQDGSTLWFAAEGILSHIENNLGTGRNLFGITLEIPRDDDKDLVIRFDEALWKQQILRQPCGRSKRLDDFFYEKSHHHDLYKWTYEALPAEVLKAVENYIYHLERYDDRHPDVQKMVDSIFDQEHYGFKAGPFFTLQEAAKCSGLMTPTGNSLFAHLQKQDLGIQKDDATCVSHFLLPQLKNLFRPGFEVETSIQLSPLYRVEERKQILEDEVAKFTKDSTSTGPSKKRALENPSSYTISDIQEVAVKRQKVPSGMAKGDDDDDDGGTFSAERGVPDITASSLRATVATRPDNKRASLTREIKPVRKGFNAFKSMGKARGPKNH